MARMSSGAPGARMQRGGGAARLTRATGSLLLAAVLALALLAGGVFGADAWASNKAPKVTLQPASVTVEEGQNATFRSEGSGVPTPTEQWEVSSNGGLSWTKVPGATTDQLTVTGAVVFESGDEYRAAFTNVAGEAVSKAATLTVTTLPAVTEQPVGVTVEEGQNAVFEAAASGFPTPTVQWQRSTDSGASWSNVGGATSDQLTISGVKTGSSGQEYRAVFKNAAGEAISNAATLTVVKRPSVTKQPLSATVVEGENANFETAGTGFPAPTVQWELSTDGGSTWSSVEGATSDKLTVSKATLSESGREYRAVFTNAAGSQASNAATLTVYAPPQVTQQPEGVTVEAGEDATFEAAASGVPTPTVQWEFSTDAGAKWSTVPGGTSDRLVVEHAQAPENGYEYRATFTNAAGKQTSAPALLTVASNHYQAVAWGSNAFGQLGDGSFTSSDGPVPVDALTFVEQVAAGGHDSVALLDSGSLMSWGADAYGQLGDGEVGTNRTTPVEVEGITKATAVAAGGQHNLALLSNGTVMAWGDNQKGQLGLGSVSESVDLPTAVPGLTNVVAIAAGAEFSLALLKDGTVMAWGDGESGQLGDGNLNNSDVPVAVKGLSSVSAISAGGEFALALHANGTVSGWGEDESGELANEAVEEAEEGLSSTPVTVEGLSGVTAVAAGQGHALALLSGHTVDAWGENSYGEIGDGTTSEKVDRPAAVSGLSNVKSISAGDADSIALLESGAAMAWGDDQFGQLGNGVGAGSYDTPVDVVGLVAAVSVSAGHDHVLAVGEPIPAVTSISPTKGTAKTSVTITGINFTGATAVHFGEAAAEFVLNSSTSITAVAPAGSGTVDVTVSTPEGTSAPRSADRFTYVPVPTVTKLSAKGGPASGGTPVTISGTEFTDASSVSFGSASTTEFKINSPFSITLKAPPDAGAAGTVEVSVSSAAGTSPPSSKARFKYAPVIESVSPGSGSRLGGTSVTISGFGFATGSGATELLFGSQKGQAVECSSSTSCTATTPAQAAGTVDVTAKVNKVKSTINRPGDEFTYE